MKGSPQLQTTILLPRCLKRIFKLFDASLVGGFNDPRLSLIHSRTRRTRDPSSGHGGGGDRLFVVGPSLFLTLAFGNVIGIAAAVAVDATPTSGNSQNARSDPEPGYRVLRGGLQKTAALRWTELSSAFVPIVWFLLCAFLRCGKRIPIVRSSIIMLVCNLEWIVPVIVRIAFEIVGVVQILFAK